LFRNVLVVMKADGSGKHAAVPLSGFPNRADWGVAP
jgi:hypothetical protein